MKDIPAFPWVMPATSDRGAVVSYGMTLRDYFAANAMQGMYASHKFPSGIMIDTAEEAYAMADAMMKAREV